MRSAPCRLIRMAIEMARESAAFFSVVDFMSCITVAKRPCYGLLKIKPSYTIIHSYAMAARRRQLMLFWLSLPTAGEQLL
jgi:hypothetical protein